MSADPDRFGSATAPQTAIETVQQQGFRFGGLSHTGSLLALPSGMFAWAPREAGEIDVDALARAVAERETFDLLILGFGPDGRGLRPAVLTHLRTAGIEFVATRLRTAVGTYNAMFSDGRRVAGAFIPDHGA